MLFRSFLTLAAGCRASTSKSLMLARSSGSMSRKLASSSAPTSMRQSFEISRRAVFMACSRWKGLQPLQPCSYYKHLKRHIASPNGVIVQTGYLDIFTLYRPRPACGALVSPQFFNGNHNARTLPQIGSRPFKGRVRAGMGFVVAPSPSRP